MRATNRSVILCSGRTEPERVSSNPTTPSLKNEVHQRQHAFPHPRKSCRPQFLASGNKRDQGSTVYFLASRHRLPLSARVSPTLDSSSHCWRRIALLLHAVRMTHGQ